LLEDFLRVSLVDGAMRPEVFSNQVQAGHEINRLGNIGVHSGVETPLLVIFGSMGCHGNDRDMAAAGELFLVVRNADTGIRNT